MTILSQKSLSYILLTRYIFVLFKYFIFEIDKIYRNRWFILNTNPRDRDTKCARFIIFTILIKKEVALS